MLITSTRQTDGNWIVSIQNEKAGFLVNKSGSPQEVVSWLLEKAAENNVFTRRDGVANECGMPITAPIPDSHDSGPDLSLAVRAHEDFSDQYLNLSEYLSAKSDRVIGFRPIIAGRLSKTSSELGILPAVKSVPGVTTRGSNVAEHRLPACVLFVR